MPLRSLMMDATVENIRRSLHRDMPASPQQDFYLWGIDPENPYEDAFLQMKGIKQMVNLAQHLLADLVQPDSWKDVADYAGRLNTYFTYEVVSDDLAIGLSPLMAGDTTFPLRREILYAFNYIMVERLTGEPTPTALLLEPLEKFIASISGFSQSLTETKYKDMLQNYLRTRYGVAGGDIEYGLWPVLVANIEMCRELTESMKDLYVGDLLRRSLVNRYQSVSRLLEATPMSREMHLDAGTWTILVAPTLTYYVGLLNEIVSPVSGFDRVVKDGILEMAVYKAAMLVRLLNDMGGMVMASEAERKAVLDLLYTTYKQDKQANSSILKLLRNVAGQSDIMGRINKDVVHGEFNISLNNLAGIASVPTALEAFEDNLNYYARVYAQQYSELVNILLAIAHRLDDPRASSLILRFVQFHQKVYANRYTSTVGEYSI
jgi:hypothetical protein